MNRTVMRLSDECPTVVGMITSSVGSGGSLDTAVRSIAADGPPASRELFSRAVRLADTKGCDGIPDALAHELGELPPQASGYKNALLLCIAASESGDGDEASRLLDEASDLALDVVRSMGERYSSSLTVPCMTVFGLGIMVPMILMSVVPMLGVGGLFGTTGIDSGTVVLITLVLIPAAILCLAVWLRHNNPFASGQCGRGWVLKALPLLSAVPMALVQVRLGSGPVDTALLSVGPAAVVTLVLMWSDHVEERRRRTCEEGLRGCVFEIGNRMLGGENFETVCPETVMARGECSDVGVAIGREVALCRGDVVSAIDRSVGPVSAEMSRAFGDVFRCSLRDTYDAGRLALSLGRQFHNSDRVRRELEDRLRSMKDMMTGTAMLFAPLVLGMSVSMLGPLSEVSGYRPVGDTDAVLTVYLVELCVLISVLSSELGGGEGRGETLWRFCVMVPVALLVFRVCCGLSLRRDHYHGAGCSGTDAPPSLGRPRDGRVRSDPGPDRGRAVHGALRHVHPPGRRCGVHRQRMAGPRPRRGHVPSGRPVLPPADGQELHPQRVAAAGLHQGCGHNRRRGLRVPFLLSPRPEALRQEVRRRRCSPGAGHGYRVDRGGLRGGHARPEARLGDLRGFGRGPLPGLDALPRRGN